LRSFLQGEPISAQSLTLFDQVARTISHHTFDARFRGMANWMMIVAPIPLTLHIVAYLLFAGRPHYALGMIATTTTMIVTILPTLLLFGVPTFRLLPAWQWKHFVTVWLGHLAATLLALFIVLVFAPLGNRELILMVYPLWATIAGLSFLAHATEAGIYYMIGGVLFACAILMALTPYWAPLEVAFLMTTNMTFQAIYLRRLSVEPPPPGPLGAHAATTIKSDS
jgi:eukaryotic-like serine/threonine-protein kinase